MPQRRPSALAAAALLALAAGCGGGDPTPSSDDALTVRHLRDERVLRAIRLDCAGADAPICRRLTALLPGLAPVPDEICTQIYGGPRRIGLDGRLGGRRVSLTVGRRDGCEIRRYDRLAAALGRAAPPAPPGVSAGG
ncbi:MAG: hypothetical protein QOD86_409 [Miltoncostaeaceae bacterium]|nr:hypothetical protein [Miltoncostaeaceae bacterium]